MAKVTTVSEYIRAQPKALQPVLRQVRETIRKAVPKAEEVISYQMPAYKLPGGTVIFFAGWKEHFAIYPATQPLVEAFKKELAPYALSKGTIRFPLDQKVPVGLISRLAKFRARETNARAAAKRRA